MCLASLSLLYSELLDTCCHNATVNLVGFTLCQTSFHVTIGYTIGLAFPLCFRMDKVVKQFYIFHNVTTDIPHNVIKIIFRKVIWHPKRDIIDNRGLLTERLKLKDINQTFPHRITHQHTDNKTLISYQMFMLKQASFSMVLLNSFFGHGFYLVCDLCVWVLYIKLVKKSGIFTPE